MEKIKYDGTLMKTMALFESITRTRLKDCFVDKKDQLIFVVDQVLLSKAIGKAGSNVKRLEKALNRKIKILGFTPDILQFVMNLVYPINLKDIQREGGVITIAGSDTRTRGLLIGKNKQNLDNFAGIIKRYFPEIVELKVI